MRESDLRTFESFNKFFTRELKDGVRSITKVEDATSISSPCDGRVLTCGEVSTHDSTIDCVKGRSYRLDEFLLGHKEDDEKIKDSKI
jgi:phosphatidylserine decarboxylase